MSYVNADMLKAVLGNDEAFEALVEAVGVDTVIAGLEELRGSLVVQLAERGDSDPDWNRKISGLLRAVNFHVVKARKMKEGKTNPSVKRYKELVECMVEFVEDLGFKYPEIERPDAYDIDAVYDWMDAVEARAEKGASNE